MSEDLSNFKFKTPIPIRFSDIDAYGNVSNTIYLTYFEITRLRYWHDIVEWDLNSCGVILGRSEINYLKPITVDDNIACYLRTSRIGNSSFDVIYVLVKTNADGEEEICTTGKSVCISYDYANNRSVPIPQRERQRMIDYDEPGLITNTN